VRVVGAALDGDVVVHRAYLPRAAPSRQERRALAARLHYHGIVRRSPTPTHATPRRRPADGAAAPATLARRVSAHGGRIAGWTLGWTLFQWWAVIGWAEGGGIYAGLLFTGVLGLVGRDLGRRLGESRMPGVVIPLRRPPPPAVEDAKAA
jgi:hypothetical protein